jgi:hypothetical protein
MYLVKVLQASMTTRSLQILCVLRCKRSLSSHFQSVTRALSYCAIKGNLKWVYDDVNHNNRLSRSRYVENDRVELWTFIHLVEHTTGPFEPIYIKYLSIKLAIYPRLNSAKKRQIRNWRHIIVCLNKTWMTIPYFRFTAFFALIRQWGGMEMGIWGDLYRGRYR